MRPRLGRALIGYAVPATRARLADIESEVQAQRDERARMLDSLEVRLEQAQAAAAEVERKIAHQHEEHHALMAVFETFSEMGRDVVRRVETELERDESRLLSALAQRQVLLGERRTLVASFQAEARRLILNTRQRLAQQGLPVLPRQAEETKRSVESPITPPREGTPPHEGPQVFRAGR